MTNDFNNAQRSACVNWKWVRNNLAKAAGAAMLLCALTGCGAIEIPVPFGDYAVAPPQTQPQQQPGYTAESLARDFNVWSYEQPRGTTMILHIGNRQEPRPRGSLRMAVNGPQIFADGDVIVGGHMDPRSGQVVGGAPVSVHMVGARGQNGQVFLQQVDLQSPGPFNLHRRDFRGEPHDSPLVLMMESANRHITASVGNDLLRAGARAQQYLDNHGQQAPVAKPFTPAPPPAPVQAPTYYDPATGIVSPSPAAPAPVVPVHPAPATPTAPATPVLPSSTQRAASSGAEPPKQAEAPKQAEPQPTAPGTQQQQTKTALPSETLKGLGF